MRPGGKIDVKLQMRYFHLPLPPVVCEVNVSFRRALAGPSHARFIALQILFVKPLSVDCKTKHNAWC